MADTNKSMELLQMALEMEKKGQAFYDEAARKCKNNLGREIFVTLSKDENIHLERVKMIYESLGSGQKWTDDWMKIKETAPVTALFEELAEKNDTSSEVTASDLDAFNVGIDLEQKSVALYERLRAGAVDPLEKKFAEKMVAEEKTHLKVLKDTKFYLTDPEAYFLEMEKAEFDAG